MNVKFSFDKAMVKRRGFMLEDVHQTIKGLFTAHDFPCVFEGDVLSCTGKGHGDDFPSCGISSYPYYAPIGSWSVPPLVSGRTRMVRRIGPCPSQESVRTGCMIDTLFSHLQNIMYPIVWTGY